MFSTWISAIKRRRKKKFRNNYVKFKEKHDKKSN